MPGGAVRGHAVEERLDPVTGDHSNIIVEKNDVFASCSGRAHIAFVGKIEGLIIFHKTDIGNVRQFRQLARNCAARNCQKTKNGGPKCATRC